MYGKKWRSVDVTISDWGRQNGRRHRHVMTSRRKSNELNHPAGGGKQKKMSAPYLIHSLVTSTNIDSCDMKRQPFVHGLALALGFAPARTRAPCTTRRQAEGDGKSAVRSIDSPHVSTALQLIALPPPARWALIHPTIFNVQGSGPLFQSSQGYEIKDSFQYPGRGM